MEEALAVAKEFRDLFDVLSEKRTRVGELVKQERIERRNLCYVNPDAHAGLAELRRMSTEDCEAIIAQRTEALMMSTTGQEERLEFLRERFNEIIERLGANGVPWKVRYALEMDPEKEGGVVQLGGRICDENGRSLFHDYCDLCFAEISNGAPRLRCFECAEILCEPCVKLKERITPTTTCPSGGGVVWECDPTLVLRLSIPSKGSLLYTFVSMMKAYSKRPCFLSAWNTGVGVVVPMTYERVLDSALRLALFMRDHLHVQPGCYVGICLASCPEFYFIDMACLMLRACTVGLVDASLEAPQQVEVFFTQNDELHANDRKRAKHIVRVGDDQWKHAMTGTPLQLSDDDLKAPGNDGGELYTVFFSSGTTGVPKGVCVSREAFRKDITIPFTSRLLVQASYLPPSWGADRLTVYQTLFNGGLIGFCRPPPQLLDDLALVHPTSFFAPPAIFKMLFALHDDARVRQVLGPRIRMLGSGGAKLGKDVSAYFASLFQCEFVEGYGISETGGVASNGKLVAGVKIRLQDAETQQDGSQIGRLWVKTESTMSAGYLNNANETNKRFVDGFFDTGDMVRVAKDGVHIEILGRADLSAIKMPNGTWLSAEMMESSLRVDGAQDVMVALVEDHLVAVVHQTVPGAIELLKAKAFGMKNGPRAFVLSKDPLPVTSSLKLNRKEVLQKYGEEMARQCVGDSNSTTTSTSTVELIACSVLGVDHVNPQLSFLECGASSIHVTQFLQKLRHAGIVCDWRKAINEPLHRIETDDGNQTAQMVERDLKELSVVQSVDHVVNVVGDNVLVTGASGFVGIHVVAELVQRKKNVVVLVRGGYVRFAQAAQQYLLPNLEQKVRVVDGDICLKHFGLSAELWQDLCQNVSLVIHSAALVDFRTTYASCRDANVVGTYHVAQLCTSSNPMKRLIHASTKNAKLGYDDGYATSKYVAEQIVSQVPRSNNVRLPFVAYSTATGASNKNDWVTRMMLACVEQCVVPSALSCSLEAVHVNDVASMLLDGNEQWCSWHMGVFLLTISRWIPQCRVVTVAEFLETISKVEGAAPVSSMIASLLLYSKSYATQPLSCEGMDRHVKYLLSFSKQT